MTTLQFDYAQWRLGSAYSDKSAVHSMGSQGPKLSLECPKTILTGSSQIVKFYHALDHSWPPYSWNVFHFIHWNKISNIWTNTQDISTYPLPLIDCIAALCLINMVYLRACAFIRSWWRCTFWMTLLWRWINKKLRHNRWFEEWNNG